MFFKRLLLLASQSSVVVEAASRLKTEAVGKIENSPKIKRFKNLIYANLTISIIAIVMSTIVLIK